jgi:hypothetical protein
MDYEIIFSKFIIVAISARNEPIQTNNNESCRLAKRLDPLFIAINIEPVSSRVPDQRDPIQFCHFDGKRTWRGARDQNRRAQPRGFLEHLGTDAPGADEDFCFGEYVVQHALPRNFIERVVPADILRRENNLFPVTQRGGVDSAGLAIQFLRFEEILPPAR